MEFTCENCKKTFHKERSEEEMQYEKNILFPEENDLVITCEPCFIQIMDFNEPNMKRYASFIDIENMDA